MSDAIADDVIARLRALGMTYPGAHPKSPWEGHDDLAVNDKTFAYLSAPGDPPACSFKLPFSGPEVLESPYARPTAYGLGKAGWVSLALPLQGGPSEETLRLWLDESYRAQAPKRLVKLLNARAAQ
jgi:predicted DNA-binding protein (MmcQ/YjbR family)